MNLRSVLTNKAVVLIATFAVSLGAATALSGVLIGGDPDPVLPEVDAPVPVIAPIATGPDAPTDLFLDAEGGSGGSGGSGGGGGSRGVVLSPVVSESAASADGDGVPGIPGVTRFVDDCAGAEPGTTPPAGCPDPSSGGTVLELFSHMPEPQQVSFRPVPDGGWTERCTETELGLRAIPYAVVTLNPGDVTLEYWRRQSDVFTHTYPTDAHPSPIQRIERSSAGEGHPEHQRWMEWFLDHTLGTEDAKHVQHCVRLSDLAGGAVYDYRVTATDAFGPPAVAQGSFVGAETRQRPPVHLSQPFGTDQYRVSVPVRSGQSEQAVVTAVSTSGPDASTCTEQEAAGIPDHVRGDTTTPISSEYFDPAYDEYTGFWLSLAEGRTHAVCIWWHDGPVRSFAPARINAREQRFVTTPNRYRVRVTLELLKFTRSVNPNEVEIYFTRPGDTYHVCSSQLPDTRVRVAESSEREESEVLLLGEVICDLTSDEIAEGRRGLGNSPAIDVHVVSPFGDPARYSPPTLTSRLDISARPCPAGCFQELSEYYSLNIPAENAVRRLCGGYGGGCPVARNETMGTALIRVDLIDGPNEGGGSPVFGTPANFAAASETEAGPPPFAQIDRLTSRVTAVDAHTLRIEANLDRPAAVTASVQPEPAEGGSPPCLLDGASGSATDASVVAEHSFVLGDLCAGHQYYVALEMRDAAGNISRAVWREGLAPAPTMVWGGIGRTGEIVSDGLLFVELVSAPDAADVVTGVVSIDGNHFRGFEALYGNRSRCIGVGDEGGDNLGRYSFGAEIELTLDLQVGPRDEREPKGIRRRDPCPVRTVHASIERTRTIPLESLRTEYYSETFLVDGVELRVTLTFDVPDDYRT